MELKFDGSIDAYLEKVNNLLIQYSFDTAVLYAVVARPFGRGFVAKIAAMDDEKGGKGILLAQLKQQVRYQVEQFGLETKKVKKVETVALARATNTSVTRERVEMYRAVCGAQDH